MSIPKGMPIVIFATLAVGKVFGFVTLSWWAVTSPLWIALASIIVVFALALVVARAGGGTKRGAT
jgi:hypothetical protein